MWRPEKASAMAFAFVLLASPGALAQSNTKRVKWNGANIHISTHNLIANKTRACQPAERAELDRRAYIVAEEHFSKHGKDVIAGVKARGGNPGRAGEFLELEFAVGCFQSGVIAIRFPANGKAQIVQIREPGRDWR